MIRVRAQLMGVLREKTPADGYVVLPPGARVRDALLQLSVDPATIHVVMVNGTMQRDLSHPLEDGDQLTVLAPVGGG